ncbi:D-aspartate oxidase [Tylopilus felleus]
MWNDRKEIIVVGAGVVGLSAAIRVQETGKYNVTIVAETFPTDPRTIRYTSHWAGAHHVSQAFGNTRQKALDKETFETMWHDSEPGGKGELFFRHTHTEFRADGIDPSTWLEYMPNFRTVSENELIPGSTAGYTFTTLTLDTPAYLNWLLARFLSGGGSTKRVNLQHISQVLDNITNPAGIIACPGIGARFLGGIEDKDVYPVRGQTILLRAPWIKYGRTLSCADGTYVYMMPLCTGNVLVGGIKVANDWHPVPRATDRVYILTSALALCPDLAPPSVRASREPTIEDLEALIVDEGCGLRPARQGGIRLEVDSLERGDGRSIPVVYNYGHSGMGFQSSWGSANVALVLLEGAIQGVGSVEESE